MKPFFRLAMAVLLCIVPLFTPSQSAHADIGPDPFPPGNSIGSSVETQVRMMEEYVQIDLAEARVLDPASVLFPQSGFAAQVKADFRMKNLGASDEAIKVYFPLGLWNDDSYYDWFITDFKVWVDGQQVSFEEEKLPYEGPFTFIDMQVWATFPVSFPAGQETLVQVEYTVGSLFVPGGSSMESVEYIFHTGAGWLGSIGKAVLVVNLLDESSQESVMAKPAGGKIDGRSITWTWINLEPSEEDDFRMELVHPKTWRKVLAARQDVKLDTDDGAAWTRLGIEYMNLATSKWDIAYPYFARLAKEALLKAVQFSPYDREPHHQLFYLYASEMGKLPRDGLSQTECDLLIAEINQFLMKTSNELSYDGSLEDMLESYNDMVCPVKPPLTKERGIYPALTATPFITQTPEPTEYPFLMETWEAYQKTRTTLTPTHVPTRTSSSTSTLTFTFTPAVTRTLLASLSPSPTVEPDPVVTNPDPSNGIVLVLFTLTGVGFVVAWRYSKKH